MQASLPQIPPSHGASDLSELQAAILRWADTWKDLLPLAGDLAVAVATLAVGVFLANRLNAAIKRTEFYVGFSSRFSEIADQLHQFNRRIFSRTSTGGELILEPVDNLDAENIYRQYFDLLFDEHHAFRKGFLDTDAYVLWMTYCALDNAGGGIYGFLLLGCSYVDAWNKYSTQPHLKHVAFVRHVNLIHACTTTAEVRRLVYRESPRWLERVASIFMPSS